MTSKGAGNWSEIIAATEEDGKFDIQPLLRTFIIWHIIIWSFRENKKSDIFP